MKSIIKRIRLKKKNEKKLVNEMNMVYWKKRRRRSENRSIFFLSKCDCEWGGSIVLFCSTITFFLAMMMMMMMTKKSVGEMKTKNRWLDSNFIFFSSLLAGRLLPPPHPSFTLLPLSDSYHRMNEWILIVCVVSIKSLDSFIFILFFHFVSLSVCKCVSGWRLGTTMERISKCAIVSMWHHMFRIHTQYTHVLMLEFLFFRKNNDFLRPEYIIYIVWIYVDRIFVQNFCYIIFLKNFFFLFSCLLLVENDYCYNYTILYWSHD